MCEWSPADARQPAEARSRFRRWPRCRTRLSAARRCTCRCSPTSRVFVPFFCDVAGNRLSVGAERRHRQVAGEQVVERRDIGRALNGRVTAQRQDAAARSADVAEQQLKNRRGANDLHAGRMLRPADRVADGRRAFRSGGAAEGVGDARNASAGRRRPPRPSPACNAQSAASEPERRSADAAASDRARGSPPPAASAGLSCCRRRPTTSFGSLLESIWIPAGEQAVQIFGVAEIVAEIVAALV